MDWGFLPLVGGLVNTIAGTAAQGNMNKKNRAFAENQANKANFTNQINWIQQNQQNQKLWEQQNNYDMMLWDKQNAYNQQLWNMQNAYNSPSQQMARYKEAGLNPNLIYGQSNMGGSVSTANLDSTMQRAGDVGAPIAARWQGQAPQFDLLNGIMSMAAFRESSARTNNLEEQKEVIKEDKFLRIAQTAAAIASGNYTQTQDASAKFKLGVDSELRDVSINAAKESLHALRQSIQLNSNRDRRETLLNASNIGEATSRVQKMVAEGKNLELDRQSKQLNLEMQRLGIMPHDNAIIRGVGKFLNSDLPKKHKWNGRVFPRKDKDGNYHFFND